jgi:hypothetical protein
VALSSRDWFSAASRRVTVRLPRRLKAYYNPEQIASQSSGVMARAAHELSPIRCMIRAGQCPAALVVCVRASQAGAPNRPKRRLPIVSGFGAGPVLAPHISQACLILAKRLFSLVQLGRLELPTS